jgi:hypothetical protein
MEPRLRPRRPSARGHLSIGQPGAVDAVGRALVPLTVKRLIICLLLTFCGGVEAAEAAVYDVPADIASDCSVAVDDEITAWLATVPDGNTARFAPGGCYGQDGTIALGGRADLVIDGQGSEVRALTPGDEERANWRFVGGANLTMQNVDVRGTNPDGVYSPGVRVAARLRGRGRAGHDAHGCGGARDLGATACSCGTAPARPPAETTPPARGTS